ncbi:NUDIX hydrolase [Accumulibacter sp.]|jgi:ADP-ribose pyrophosphatase YjhB (NUDIX family)|uniref:NUDIX hydrolase n=1 Tax=Accumulibacter sp. TaxID=2053492 RepID=UPI001AD4E0A9|nr:NUDIX hydrolase [Accumulibacter sp.]MBN8453382.1 NUDIX hydrolase [Accumulibacter sp.]MBO3705019.1 NUDIX hydrolase [Candidatus Accumulibacter conexus]
MIWKPNVTVAAVLERDGRFLLVEEETEYGIRFNQPAGHLDWGESLLDAAVRETLEETAYTMRPDALVGIYLYPTGAGDLAYLRFAFAGEIVGHDPARQLDAGILAAHWLTVDEIRARQAQHRSPMVLRCIDDWLAGRRYPLQLLSHYACAG